MRCEGDAFLLQTGVLHFKRAVLGADQTPTVVVHQCLSFSSFCRLWTSLIAAGPCSSSPALDLQPLPGSLYGPGAWLHLRRRSSRPFPRLAAPSDDGVTRRHVHQMHAICIAISPQGASLFRFLLPSSIITGARVSFRSNPAIRPLLPDRGKVVRAMVEALSCTARTFATC